MELRLLRTFQCVASCLNFSKAAEMLNFSQPTVSTQIQMLEEELGQKLFVHVGKKTYLTPEGTILKEDADRILCMAEEVSLKFQSMTNTTRILKIAAHESFCNLNLPKVINAYLHYMKKVNVDLTAVSTNEVINGIRKNQYDIGIISGDVDYAGVECLTFDETKVEIIVASELTQTCSLEEIVEKYPYFRYRADAMQYSLDLNQVLVKSGIVPQNVMKFGSLKAIKEAVKSGLGYTVVTRDNVEKELKNGELSIITPSDIEVMSMTSAVFLADSREREEVKEFIRILKEVWDETE